MAAYRSIASLLCSHSSPWLCEVKYRHHGTGSKAESWGPEPEGETQEIKEGLIHS